MAAYPTLPITANSRPVRTDGIVGQRATNGTLKTRKTMAGEKYDFELEHELTLAQWTALENHYQADKNNAFPFTWPTAAIGTRTVRYLSAPQPIEVAGVTSWLKARLRLGEV